MARGNGGVVVGNGGGGFGWQGQPAANPAGGPTTPEWRTPRQQRRRGAGGGGGNGGGGGGNGGGSAGEDGEEERLAMVAAARAGRRFQGAPTVRIEEVVEEDGGKEDKEDRIEVVQAGSPFVVNGGSGGG